MLSEKSEQELEAKFCVLSFDLTKDRIFELEGQLKKDRQHERNLRFDTPHQDLTRVHKVLRLRQDHHTHLTFKGPAEHIGGISKRREIEFQATDFTAANNFLKALGFQVSVIYEKYRTTFELNNLEITFDEMPYGLFIEIEGPNVKAIKAVAESLNLNWDYRLSESYLTLFYRLKNALNLSFRDLTFENFNNIQFELKDLAIQAADQ